MANIKHCDVCGQSMAPLGDYYSFDGPLMRGEMRVMLKTIVDGKWKTKDVCIDCMKIAIEKGNVKIKAIGQQQ